MDVVSVSAEGTGSEATGFDCLVQPLPDVRGVEIGNAVNRMNASWSWRHENIIECLLLWLSSQSKNRDFTGHVIRQRLKIIIFQHHSIISITFNRRPDRYRNRFWGVLQMIGIKD